MKQNVLFVCLIAGFIAGWVVNGWRLVSIWEAEKVELVQENAEQFRDATARINDSATSYVGNAEQLEKQIDALKKELANAKKRSPLPDVCRPDAKRLRILTEAVHAANATTRQ